MIKGLDYDYFGAVGSCVDIEIGRMIARRVFLANGMHFLFMLLLCEAFRVLVLSGLGRSYS